jgi:hypothetical protein
MGENGWSLEVVKGRQAGRSYALAGPEVVLGNAPADASAIDLAEQEGDTPRRMAARQAVVAATPAGLLVRDLDSPGGTFVNRQRVLPGQLLPLRAGDVLQLGGVQLKVVTKANGQPATAPAAAPLQPFVLKNGTTCRTWDDFLRVAAQRWSDVRDELVSGRISVWLSTIGRPDLIVQRPPDGSPDEHLDAWLARLPTSAPARPELDVHPSRLVVRVTPGGGTIARSVQVANVGHRLLHVRAEVEPAGWARVASAFAGRTHAVVDALDIPIEIDVPTTLRSPLRATLRIDGDGGTKQVELVLEARGAAEPMAAPPSRVGPSPLDRLARIPPAARFVAYITLAIVIRLVAGVVCGSMGMSASELDLLRVALLFAVAFGLTGAILARRAGIDSVGYAAASAAIAGCASAALFVATCRIIEPVLGGWSHSILAIAFLWAAIGAAKAAASLWIAPYREPAGSPTP